MKKIKRNGIFILALCLIAVFFSVSLFMNFDNSSIEENDNLPVFLEEGPPLTEVENSQVVETIMVDLKGAVAAPGVYEIEHGSRVIDVIEKAGGLLDDASDKELNLALLLEDEMVIYVPKVGETEVEVSHSTIKDSSDGKININTATSDELQNIPGIGPSKASAIISYREENGKFSRIEDIENVTGIGKKTVERIAEFITVSK